MKKIAIILIVLMIVGAGALACESTGIIPVTVTSTPTVSGLPFTEIPWGNSEQASYRIEDITGTILGTSELMLEKNGDNYILSKTFDFGKVKAENVIEVYGNNLMPISSRQMVFSENEARLNTVSMYSDGRVSIEVTYETLLEEDEESSGEQTPKIEKSHLIIGIPSVVYENDEIFFIGRALPFELGYYVEFADLFVSQFMTPIVAFTVTDREEIEVPAGTFDCYKVKVGSISGETEQPVTWLWYEVEAPHRLIKYASGQNNFLLTEHS